VGSSKRSAPRADVEAAFVRAFVVPAKQGRLLGLLPDPRRRATLLRTLYHFRDLDPRFAEHVSPAEQSPEGVERLLRKLGAPEHCYLISDVGDLDARLRPLTAALDAIVGQGGGTLVSCLAGRLGYFEGEEPGDRWILHRPQARPG
jgi:hypothetical protein